MPKTASKRAQVRRAARVQRAHQVPAATVPRAVSRRDQPARRKAKRPTGFSGFLRTYPVASTIFTLLLVGLFVGVAANQKIGPFAPPAKKPIPQATCDLKTHHCSGAPLLTIDASKTYTATIKTAKGDIVLALDAKNTPQTVNNFVFLAQQHWYDGTFFWRVEHPDKPSPIDTSPNPGPSGISLIQGGSVKDNGQDGATAPGYTIPDEKGQGSYTEGSIAMANTGQANSGSAQFFINSGDNSKAFSPTYTIFGQVTSGMDVVKQISPKDTIQSVTIAVK